MANGGATPQTADRYLKWTHAVVIMYSITSRPTFDTARTYLDIICQYQRSSGRDLAVILVANKTDLERYRTVSKATGQALASEFECLFREISAADDEDSVRGVFRDVIREALHRSQAQAQSSSFLASSNLQPLFISEDKSSSLGQQTTPRQALRRPKSPKSSTNDSVKKDSIKDKDKEKEAKDAKDLKIPRKNASASSAFKFFNKNFKLF